MNFINHGFTIIEVVIVIAVLVILAAVSVGSLMSIQKQIDLNNTSQELVGVMQLAQNKTLASESDDRYGVYLDFSSQPNRYILFQGSTYASRTQSYDQKHLLPSSIKFSQSTNLGGSREVDFDKLTGASDQSGQIVLQNISTSKEVNIYVSSSGSVGFASLPASSDNDRLKDSRHIHFDYSRSITYNTSVSPCTGETVDLYFNGASLPQQQIPVCSNLVAGEIEWLGTVSVSGSSQTVQVHTHRLNNPDTQFSIHRDGRLNTKSLIIKLSGDSSGNLASYSADGLTTSHSSIYVSNFAWQ